MQKLIRSKPYKAVDPEITINRCKSILEKLGIKTFENFFTSHENAETSFWYCRVGFDKYPNYSAGGKGWTKQYALASGYGELIERLQNNLLISLPKNKEFLKAPDEKYINLNDVIKQNSNILTSIFEVENDIELERIIFKIYGDKILSLPYYNISDDSVHYLPIGIVENFINLYNGNCAGNTNNEAIIHGICEILERYAIREIYKNEYSLPEISIEYFKDFEIYNRIKYLEKEKNIKVIIKDCSIGEQLPVIGAILIDKNSNRYSFQLGSDPSPVTALERCFTEIFQDGRNFAHITHVGVDPFEPKGFYDRFTLKAQNYVYTNDFAKGKWPNSIFLPSNEKFTGFEYLTSESDEKDLQYLLELLEKKNRKIYIRDVSYLGFPAFNIFMPGMSEHVITNSEKYAMRMKQFMKNIHVLENINGHKNIEIANLANSIDSLIKDPEPFIPFDISIIYKHINDDVGRDMNNELFLFLLYYRVEDFKKASFYINRYIETSGIPDDEINLYHLCIRDFVALKCRMLPLNSIDKILRTIYSFDLVEEVLNDMKDPSNIFQYHELPSCPHCEKCNLKQNCSVLGIVEISQKLYEKMITSSIDQNSLIGFGHQIKEDSCEYTT